MGESLLRELSPAVLEWGAAEGPGTNLGASVGLLYTNHTAALGDVCFRVGISATMRSVAFPLGRWINPPNSELF